MATARLSFAQDIKPLFREKDRDAMRGAFDLWAYSDVVAHADAIAHQVRAGTMPCDGAWSQDKVADFQRWLDEGAAE